MSGKHENAHSSTGTSTKQKDVSNLSGMCPICTKDCTILCEISKSSFRGREVLYPTAEYFGDSTAASNKNYFLDWSDIQIMVDVLGAQGIDPNPDKAIFPNADVSTIAGGVPLSVPIVIPGLGSTDVAKRNWDALAVGSAISGAIMTIGENIAGMDPDSKYKDGKVIYSKDLEYRINAYRKFWDGVHGEIVVQTNVEDQRAGIDQYAINELGVNIIERKWGQGAKAIGGEVRIDNLEKALMLKKRGYVVLPDPEDAGVQEAFKEGDFKTFERHSRVGFPEAKSFVEDIKWLRKQGAKKVFLKTGAYNAAATAFTLKVASEAKIDLLTFDGAGGGTGMSPVPMMQECSTPTIYLLAQVLHGMQMLKKSGRYCPDLAIAGGIVNETQIYKAFAMSNFGDGPYVKAVGMARSPITAAFKGEHFAELAKNNGLPKKFAETYGTHPEHYHIAAHELKERYGDEVGKGINWGAVGIYTYFVDKVGYGLKQLLAGSRKFKLELLDRTDIASLTQRAAQVTGIPLLEQKDLETFEAILGQEKKKEAKPSKIKTTPAN